MREVWERFRRDPWSIGFAIFTVLVLVGSYAGAIVAASTTP